MTIIIVPWLRSGKGETPADGGCINQVIDWIDRGEWTDTPPCVRTEVPEISAEQWREVCELMRA
jgi:hypothetical protein